MKTPLQTLAQWLAQVNEYVPEAYIRVNSTHLQSLHANGCSPSEAVEYARAYLFAPQVTPRGWEGVHPFTVQQADALCCGFLFRINLDEKGKENRARNGF